MELQQIHFPFSENSMNQKGMSTNGHNLIFSFGLVLLLFGGAYTIYKLTSKKTKNESQN
jgi:hypothetical protein